MFVRVHFQTRDGVWHQCIPFPVIGLADPLVTQVITAIQARPDVIAVERENI